MTTGWWGAAVGATPGPGWPLPGSTVILTDTHRG